MTTQTEALKLALEGLDYAGYLTEPEGELNCNCLICQATVAVKEALAQPEQEHFALKHRIAELEGAVIGLQAQLAQPEQEPVGWFGYDQGTSIWFETNKGEDNSVPLYTTPPQRTWVGLTNDERQDIALEVPIDAVLITEFKLKEKNCG